MSYRKFESFFLFCCCSFKHLKALSSVSQGWLLELVFCLSFVQTILAWTE